MSTLILGKGALANSALKREAVDVPEWGGAIILRELSAREQSDLTMRRKALTEDTDINAGVALMVRYIAYAWINEDGTHVLGEDDMDALLDQPVSVLKAISDVALRLSGDMPEAAAEAKKNLSATRNGASGSVSPLPSAAAL